MAVVSTGHRGLSKARRDQGCAAAIESYVGLWELGMNQRFLSVLIFAFVVAAGASFMLYRLMAGRVTTKAAEPSTKVIMAARRLDLGTVLRDADLKEGAWPGALPTGATLKKDEVIGRGIISPIYENEPIVESRLAPKGQEAGWPQPSRKACGPWP